MGNSIYGVAEYIAQPGAMIVAAPLLIHRLGAEQYGIWMLVSALVGGIGTLSTGFGDATVKYVSSCRGRNDTAGIEHAIRTTLTINVSLGLCFAILIYAAAPTAVHRIFTIAASFQHPAEIAIRIGAIVLAVRSVEGVFVSTLRAFERYGPPVKLNVRGRVITVLLAVILAAYGYGVVAIMAGTLGIAVVECACQVLAARRITGNISMWPRVPSAADRELLSYGCFTWLQALAAVAFTYADRLLIGAMIGTTAVAYYTICVQATQSIHGLTAAGLNFLFPHISRKHEARKYPDTREAFRAAFVANVVVVATLAGPFVVFPRQLLGFWLGASFANQTHTLLLLLAIAFGLLALNVTPHYTLLALGDARFVSIVNIAAGFLSLVAAAVMIPALGLTGAALARCCYGPAITLNMWRARRALNCAAAAGLRYA
jgi:O-antigen/teichoic acid export membrane protein